MFMFSALQMTIRKKNQVNRSLFFLFLCLGYIWLYYGLYRATRLAWAPWLLYSDVVVTYMAGPVLLAYVKNLAGKKPPKAALRSLPFVPALAVLVFLVVARPWMQWAPLAGDGINPDHFAIPAIRVINTLGDFHFFCHVALCTYLVRGLMDTGDRKFRRHFKGVFVYFANALLTMVIFLAGHVAGNENILGIAVLANGINSVYFFFLSYRYPEYTLRAVCAPPNGERASIPQRGRDVRTILAGLERAVEGEGGYRDPDITLQSMSTRLGIQHHRLSQIMNESLGTNFRGYINRRRVDEAKKLLAAESETSILDIAFAVGFNSKSAFNSVFSKETGLSPSDFRKTSPRRPEIVNQDDRLKSRG
jgi:AraC-like DNA-binding protein